MSVSVAVCSKGRTEELRKLARKLRSLIDNSQLKECNLIIVEDISEAAVAPLPVDMADLYLALDEKGLGFGAIRQRAVEACDNDILVFIDDDCIPCAEWLEHITAPFLDDEVVAVGGGILPQKGNVVACATALIGLPGGGIPRLIIAGERENESNSLSTGNLALRREAIIAAGGFDVRHHHGGEDQQLVGALTGRKIFLPTAVVEHRNREHFSDIWRWFVRRGRGEYRINRLGGMGKLEALLSPLRWSWFLRLPIFALVAVLYGIGWAALVLAIYYVTLAAKVYLANRCASPLQIVEESRRSCLTPSVVAIAPLVRLCMDFGREAGRLMEWRRLK